LGQLDAWDEPAIKARGHKLAQRAVGVWAAPQLAPDILEVYRTSAPSAGYRIEDHPHLLPPAMRELFECFRKDVLSLDACVTKEFLKLYVAYKAETNFVDVVPQAKRLRLSINMKVADINDPRRICKDVSNLGRWGNGDVEVGLTSVDDLPYVSA
jgi:predicted transport protein